MKAAMNRGATAGPWLTFHQLVVVWSFQRPARRAMAISRLFRPYPFPMDILVRTPEELEHRLQIGDMFLQEIANKGKVLYERGIP